MSVRDSMLPILDRYRGKLDTVFGLRRYDVALIVSTWAPGTLPGQGSPTVTETALVVDSGARPKVEELSQRDILASGGLYQDQDLKIGPLTPPYGSGQGTPVAALDPPVVGSNVEILYRLTGPGCENGAFYKKVGQEVTRNFRYSIVVRRVGALPSPIPGP